MSPGTLEGVQHRVRRLLFRVWPLMATVLRDSLANKTLNPWGGIPRQQRDLLPWAECSRQSASPVTLDVALKANRVT